MLYHCGFSLIKASHHQHNYRHDLATSFFAPLQRLACPPIARAAHPETGAKAHQGSARGGRGERGSPVKGSMSKLGTASDL